MDSDSLQLRDLTPADPFIQTPGWPWWAWVLVTALATGAFFITRSVLRKKHSILPPDLAQVADRAYQTAMDKLDQLDPEGTVQKTATGCSSAIRGYLASVCGDPSLFETHEEFLSRHEALSHYPLDAREAVSYNFNRLASLKYGKTSNAEPTTIADDGRSLLQKLHQSRPG